MFAVVVSGRPVIMNYDKLSESQISFTIPSFPPFNHLVIFALPGTVLPADAAAAVYIQIPPSTGFKLLGALANDKQSAIFKIRSTPAGNTVNGIGAVDEDAMIDETTSTTTGGSTESIILGISLEPVQQVATALANLKASQPAPLTGSELVRRSPATPAPIVPTKVLAQRIIANAFNFLASFSSGGVGGQETVPLKSLQEWWKKFEGKIERDPSFLERGEVD
jgi:protein Hikeshi